MKRIAIAFRMTLLVLLLSPPAALLAQLVRPDASMKVVPTSQVGNTIEDGVGFGGIRIGAPETELLSRWGPAKPESTPRGYMYSYLLESGEAVLVQIENGEVASFLFWPSTRLSSFPSTVKTLKGIAIGDRWERVRVAYGRADSDKGQSWSYLSHGVGFVRDVGFVAAIMIFKPGKLPEGR